MDSLGVNWHQQNELPGKSPRELASKWCLRLDFVPLNGILENLNIEGPRGYLFPR